jgi:hypothetical protein
MPQTLIEAFGMWQAMPAQPAESAGCYSEYMSSESVPEFMGIAFAAVKNSGFVPAARLS